MLRWALRAVDLTLGLHPPNRQLDPLNGWKMMGTFGGWHPGMIRVVWKRFSSDSSTWKDDRHVRADSF